MILVYVSVDWFGAIAPTAPHISLFQGVEMCPMGLP